MLTDEDDLRATAYHEAGHAVLIAYFHYSVERATISRDLASSPHIKPASPEKIALEHSVIIAMAGAACIDAFNIPSSDQAGGGCGDFAKIQTTLAELIPDNFD